MNENSKCFIKIREKEYEEITLRELEYRRNTINEYRQKKFIYVHKMLMEVSEEEYKEYHYEKERNKYCKKVLDKLSIISIDELETQDKSNILIDTSIDIENDYINKVSREDLYKSLLMLDLDEIELIKELFFNNYSLRKYAQKVNMSHNTLYSKLKKILDKLRKLLNY